MIWFDLYVGNGFFTVHLNSYLLLMVLVILISNKFEDLFLFSYSMVYWIAGSSLFRIYWKVYWSTKQLQRQKVKHANSKNQLIFLERCITNKLIPKSFQVKPSILSKKGKMLQEEYQMKLLKLARSEWSEAKNV